MLLIDTLPPYTTLADTTADSLHTLCAYDTIFTPVGRIEPVLHKSLFTHHLLPVENTHEIAIQHQGSPGWPLIFIALSITLICIFLRNKQIGILDLLHSAIDSRAMDRTLRDSNLTHATDQAIIAPLMLLPVVLIAYFSYAPRLANIWFDILTFLLSLLAACVVYYSRNGIIRLFGNAFDNTESVHIYLSSNYIFHLLYAIVATCFAFFIFYTDRVGQTFLYILIGILALLFIVRLVRGMQLILTNSKTPKFYLFYYLCILEILPIIVLAKVAMYL